MKRIDLFGEIIATYSRHGWQLKRALISEETRREMGERAEAIIGKAVVKEAAADALWFARPSTGGREAWELRLISEAPYALFEAFESDEAEEDREDVRREMEARLIEVSLGGVPKVDLDKE